MIIITLKISKGLVRILRLKLSKKIGGNNYIENIQKDWWEYLVQKIQ